MPVDNDVLVPFFQRLRQASEEVAPWLGDEVYAGLTSWNILAFGTVAILTALVHLILHSVIRTKLCRDELEEPGEEPLHQRETRSWWDLLLDAALSPLAVLVWVYGLYLACFLLLLSLRELEEPPMILRFLDWVWSLGFFIILVWFLFRAIGAIDVRLRRRAKRSGSKWDRILAPLAGRTLRLVLPLAAVIFGLPLIPMTEETLSLARTGLSLLIIVFIAAILIEVVRAVEEGVLWNFPLDVSDNLQARKIQTQVTVLKKVAIVLIAIFALASILMVFEPLRRFGASILASAGIAGIIVGFAAQRSIATLLAGFQIAMTQPIRLDDVVIVENEWGRIEEITLTYVVVRIWDLRRLVMPIDYFISQPFQNWTRTSADILGSVFLHMDYTVPIPELRRALDHILEESPAWDGKTKGVQVTDAKERTLEVRVLVSAADAGAAWDLRCHVREKMIEFVRENYPQALPHFRAEVSSPPISGASGGSGLLPGAGGEGS